MVQWLSLQPHATSDVGHGVCMFSPCLQEFPTRTQKTGGSGESKTTHCVCTWACSELARRNGASFAPVRRNS